MTTVASSRGTKPSTVADPFIIGMPPTSMLSLTATLRPASGPVPAPVMAVRMYQAPSWLAASSGQPQGRTSASVTVARYRRSTVS